MPLRIGWRSAVSGTPEGVPQTADKVSRKALVIHWSLLYFGFMLKRPEVQQHELEMVSVESLVPSEHLLRKIDRVVDFGFIHDRVKHLYADNNGRPALDPVVLFKLLLLGYLYGVRSERQLMREVEVNVAYRWFLGLKLRDKVPDASTLSQNRRRRFAESTIYQEIFDEIVLLAVNKGLAGMGTRMFPRFALDRLLVDGPPGEAGKDRRSGWGERYGLMWHT